MPDPKIPIGIPKPASAPTPSPPPPTPTSTPAQPVVPAPQSSAPICEIPNSSTPAAQEFPTPTNSTVEPATSELTPAVPPEELPPAEEAHQSDDIDQTTNGGPSTTPAPAPAPSPTPPQPVAARKQSIVVVYSVAPDVCVMPNGSFACFDLCAIGDDAVNQSPDVFANQAGVIKLDTKLLVCSGDEPAVGGALSDTIKNLVEMLPNGCKVITNGKVTIRDKDLCTMNNKNTIGIVTVVEAPPPDDSEDALDDLKKASDVLEGYQDAADKSDKADADAKKAERGTGRGKKNKKRPESPRASKDRAKARAQKKANLEKARAKAKKFEVPGKATKAGKIARNLPGLGDAIDAYQVGSELYEGNYGNAADKSAGVLAGKAAAAAAAAICLASGPGVLVCAGVAIASDWIVGDFVEHRGIFGGEGSANQTPAQTPNPTPSPSENGVPSAGGNSASPQPSSTPVPQPVPNPTPPPAQSCVTGMGEDGVLNLCINGPGGAP